MTRHRFDEPTASQIRRRGSLKWTRHGPEVLPAWVAEMDFPLADPVMSAVRTTVDAELFGYPPDPLRAEVRRSTADWLGRGSGWVVDPRQVFPLPDVVCGIAVAVDTHSPAGSPVIVPTPAYPPFFQVIEGCGRSAIQVPMDGATLDLAAIGAAFTAGGRTLLLCNPHNPTGRVFTRAELSGLADVVDRHGGRVIADEIHAPLVYGPNRHLPYATVSGAAAAHTVTLVSASKAWNLPGLRCAQAILAESDVAAWAALPFLRTWGLSPIGMAATVAAYDQGHAWLVEVLTYLDSNRRRLGDLLTRYAPQIGHVAPEGTYLGWLDLRGADLPGDPAGFLLTEARIALTSGASFGVGGAGHVRLNFATPQPILDSIVLSLTKAVNGATHIDPASLAGR